MIANTPAEFLMRQASMTAQFYMLKAKADIDEMFGNGYAAKHPELVAAYMQTAARDFQAMIAYNQQEEISARL